MPGAAVSTRRTAELPRLVGATVGRRAVPPGTGGPPCSPRCPALRRRPSGAARRAGRPHRGAVHSRSQPPAGAAAERARQAAAAGPTRQAAVATAETRRARSRRPPAPRRPTTRTIKAPDPRQRARRTIRVRTARLTSRFSAGQPRKRLITTLVVMLLILSAVLVKVGALQTFEGDALRNAAAQQWTRDRPLRAQRGSIFDRNGEELALSVPASTIAVNPKQVEDPDGTAGHVRPDPRPVAPSGATSWPRRWPPRTAASSTSPARSTTCSPSSSPTSSCPG